ncbi:hypothetical protein ACKAV7_011767 [Fusarium commune]
MILRLRKALYGLRRLPLLWQRHLEAGLKALGFQRVAGENCCWQKERVTFFFYVDDCILAFLQEDRRQAMEAITALQQKYHREGGENLQWFLGIEVIRDRKERKLWLSQAVYCDKAIQHLTTQDWSATERPPTPMTKDELLPSEREASLQKITQYQKKIGTILYAAVMTRPDIAFAASRLARFNQNPGHLHQKAADRALRYLQHTRHLCLEFGATPGGPEDIFEVASDASFADNSLDRQSSQAFEIKLFGSMIAWRANKQGTVTTSTTEAELLALSSAANEALFASRLITALQVRLPDNTTFAATFAEDRRYTPKVKIQCDNLQTVRLVTTELVKLQTKLRHVDIHNHWLHQEIAEGRIAVTYTPTAEIMADGLTKSLARPQFEAFTQQLNMRNQQDLLEENRRRELADDERKLENLLQKEDLWDL